MIVVFNKGIWLRHVRKVVVNNAKNEMHENEARKYVKCFDIEFLNHMNKFDMDMLLQAWHVVSTLFSIYFAKIAYLFTLLKCKFYINKL
jgi:hypothetical protein